MSAAEPCPRCKAGALRPLLSRNRQGAPCSWEADHCDACGASWWHNPPRLPPVPLPEGSRFIGDDVGVLTTDPTPPPALESAARRTLEGAARLVTASDAAKS